MKRSAFASISSSSRRALPRLAFAAVACGTLFVACVSDEAGIPGEPGSAGTPSDAAGAPASVSGSGSGGKVSSSGASTGGSAPLGGSADIPGDHEGGHDGHEHPVGSGGTPDLGGAPGEGGAGGATEPEVAMRCVFHTDAPEVVTGAGGAPAADIVVQQNPFVGAYLTDSAGRTLYTYGADLPGDCNSAPVSRCDADCPVSWPIFDGGARVLGAGLDDAAFGTITRGDGSKQVTYYGWPLYYYKTDLSLGQLTGQGKGKTWHVAETTPPSVVIMKAGTVKYLADGTGRTLYVSAADTAGSDEDPISSCSDACLDSFKPFHEKRLSVVSSLDPAEFTVFVRKGKGGLQLAYKGLPLYLAVADTHTGDMHGAEISGFTAALP